MNPVAQGFLIFLPVLIGGILLTRSLINRFPQSEKAVSAAWIAVAVALALFATFWL